eukprot:g18425.t1
MHDFIASTDPLVVRSDRQGYRIFYGDMKLVGDTIMVTNVQPCDYRDARPTLVGQKAPNLKNKSKKQLQVLCGDRADAEKDSATRLMVDAFQNLSQRRMFFDPWAVKMQRSRLISRLAVRSQEADKLKRKMRRQKIGYRNGLEDFSGDDAEADGDGDMVVAEVAAETARQERLRRSFDVLQPILNPPALPRQPKDGDSSSAADAKNGIEAEGVDGGNYSSSSASASKKNGGADDEDENSGDALPVDVASLDLMGVNANDYHDTGAERGDHDEASDDGEEERHKAEDKMDGFFAGDETGGE